MSDWLRAVLLAVALTAGDVLLQHGPVSLEYWSACSAVQPQRPTSASAPGARVPADCRTPNRQGRRDPKHQISSLVLRVDLLGSRRIWAALRGQAPLGRSSESRVVLVRSGVRLTLEG
jgi:hypothetical protein